MAGPPIIASWILEHMLDPNIQYATLTNPTGVLRYE